MGDLPPGYRFYPTEEELISFYLHNKLHGTRPDLHRVIPLLDIYDYNPWELPLYAGERCGLDSEQWFFFIPRQEREARGGRPNRLTTEGYWKATGSPSDVYSCNNRVIGRKRTMVFYVGRAPNGRKTTWKMNEYKAVLSAIDHNEASSSSSTTTSTPQLRDEFSLCRIYMKSKCLRSFDRRPPPQLAARDAPQVAARHHHHHHHNESTTSLDYQNIPILVPDHIITDHHRSLDSSSSGDQMITNYNASQSVESGSNADIAVEGTTKKCGIAHGTTTMAKMSW